MPILYDLEANGFLETVTKIHCCVLYNTDTGKYKKFTPEDINLLPSFLDKCTNLVAHNQIGYDLKVLKKIFNYEYKGKIDDTLLLSRIIWPDREGGKNPHSIESYGNEFGVPKPLHEDWEVFSEEMLHRCTEDVNILIKLWEKISSKIEEMGIPTSDWQFITGLEHKVWRIIEDQADYGWEFNLQKAYELVDILDSEIKNTENILLPKLPITVVKSEKETKAFTSKGDPAAIALKWVGDEAILGGNFSKVRFEPFNLNSDSQVKDYLLQKGWEPKEFNFKKDRFNKPLKDKNRKLILTSPKLPKSAEDWEEIAELLDNEDIKLLVKYNKMTHRRSQIKGLIAKVRADHRIEAQANTCRTNTARMTHRVVVNIPKAKPDVYLGTEMRSLFVASAGKILVGCDADALEARVEGHYIYPYDKASALELIEGDIHTKNATNLNVTRDKAKTIKYMMLYGGGPSKIVDTMKVSMSQAKEIHSNYWSSNPGLLELKDKLEYEFNNTGFIKSIDGRPLSVRYKHALINTLFQSTGSIAMKLALCICQKEFDLRGLYAPFIGNFHDEFECEVDPKIAQEVAKIQEDSIRRAGEYFKFNIALSGKAQIGYDWSEIH